MTPAAALAAARALLERPDPLGALHLLDGAVAQDAPEEVRIEAHRLIGRLRTGLGQPLHALRHYDALLVLRPGNAEARFLRARAFLQLGWHDRALAAFAALPQPLPGWWEAERRDARQRRATARQGALRAFAARRAGKRLRVQATLVLRLLRAGRIRAAEGLLARARTGRPRDAALDLAAALLALHRGETPSVRELPQGTPVPLRLQAAALALQLDRPEAALDLLKGAEGSAEVRLARLRARILTGARITPPAKDAPADPADLWTTRVRFTQALLSGGFRTGWTGATGDDAAPVPLIQFWHDASPPPDVAAAMRSWTELNPRLARRLFDAGSARALVAAEAPSLLPAFDLAWHPAMQADILRLVALHAFGGLYVDADERCLRPAPDLLAGAGTVDLAAIWSDEIPCYANNALILARPRSRVVATAIALLAAELPVLMEGGRRPGIWNATGPGLLTRALLRHAGEPDVVLMSRAWLAGLRATEDSLAYKGAAGGDWRAAGSLSGWDAAVRAEAEGRLDDALALAGTPAPGSLAAARALLLGTWLARRPDPLAALPYLTSAAADGPPNERVEALLRLGRLRAGLGQHLLVAAHLRDLLALRPGHAEACFLLARALFDLGWPDMALRALAGLGTAPAGWWAGVARDARAQLAEARIVARHGLGQLREGAAPAPPLLRALLRAGRLRAAAGLLPRLPPGAARDLLAALIALRDAGGAATLPPGLSGSEAAVLLVAAGEPEAALAAFDDMPEDTLPARLRMLRAQAMIAAGQAPRLEALAAERFAAAPRKLDWARQLLTARLVLRRATPWRHAPPGPHPVPPVPLVQYWDAAEPPADVRATMEGWVRAHPGLVPHRFDDASARAFLAACHGDAGAAAFDACHNAALRSNLLRIAFLAAHGGLWVDADERCLRPMDEVLCRLDKVGLVAVVSAEMPFYLHNYMLAAPPGSAVMQALDAAQMDAFRAAARGRGRIANWVTNGPGLVTRIAMRHEHQVALLDNAYWRCFAADAAELRYKRDARSDCRAAPVAPGITSPGRATSRQQAARTGSAPGS